MSSRDLCALDVVPELVKGGLDSFKIEGRTRSVYYLSQVVRAYRMAIDVSYEALVAGESCSAELVPAESRRAISCVDGRGFMPGFLRGPVPQNYESTHEEAPGGCVAAQVIAYDASANACRVNVKNPFSIDDSLELMTPSGMTSCSVSAMKDFKGGDVDRLHPGTEGWVFFSEDVKGLAENATFCFFVRKNP